MKIGIIGGGIYGASIAYFLKKLGADDVLLIEKDHIASKSTGYSAGIIRHHYEYEPQIRLAARGREILEDLDDSADDDVGLYQNGCLRLAGENNADSLQNVVSKQQELGIDVDILEPPEIEEIFQGINTEHVELASFEHEAGFADPYLITTTFASKAADLGANILSQTEIQDISDQSNGGYKLHSSEGTYTVDFVVNAAGPWGDKVGEMAGVDLPLKWYESKIAVLRSSVPYDTDLPTISDTALEPDLYTKPEPSGDFLVGGINRPPVNKNRGLQGMTMEDLQNIATEIERRLPKYADADVVQTWSGIITMTPDSNQIVGVPNEMENFYNVVGGSGHGFKHAPAFAESIAQSILSKEPRIDLSPYRLERFEEGELIDDQDYKTYG